MFLKYIYIYYRSSDSDSEVVAGPAPKFRRIICETSGDSNSDSSDCDNSTSDSSDGEESHPDVTSSKPATASSKPVEGPSQNNDPIFDKPGCSYKTSQQNDVMPDHEDNVLLQAAGEIMESDKGSKVYMIHHLGVNNLKIIIKDVSKPCDSVITDDEKRDIELPFQVYWQIRQYFDNIITAFGDVMNKKSVQFKLHLGANYYINIASPFWVVHLNPWGYCNGDFRHAPGISFKRNEWIALRSAIANLDFPAIHEFTPCFLGDDHQNQEGMLQCCMCSPK